jgi:pimeloyl-ACP methyl ester carboxylesterase
MTAPEANALKTGVAAGTPDGRPPLVLLHGLTFDSAMWRPALAELSRIDPERQVLTLDLPGHGGSAAWPRYDIQNVADAVNAAVTSAGLCPPVVVGHSMAALIAMDYAARYPVRGVVNVDTWLRQEQPMALVKSLAGEIRGGGFATAWRLFEDSMHIELLPDSARRLLRPASAVRQDVVAGYWRMVFDWPAERLAAFFDAIIAKLRANQVSYLFVAGHQVEPEYLDWLGERLPQAAVEVLQDSGHFPQLAHPARFAACLASTAQWPTAPARQDSAA